MAKMYATPGVYIEEKSAFPNSVVPVATAVPAFIGYTEKAIDGKKDLKKKPKRISSLGEYLLYFGGAPKVRFNVEDVSAADPMKVYQLDVVKESHYNLYFSMRLFFANGGSDCYIVSVGSYEDKISKDELSAGIDLLLKEPEPTMLVIPEAILLEKADCYSLQQDMLMHCGLKMRNRVSILDVYNGDKKADDAGDVIAQFRSGVGNNFRDFGASYYPWLHTTITSSGAVDFRNINGDTREVFMKILKDEVKASVKQGLLEKKRGSSINAEIANIPGAIVHTEREEVFKGINEAFKVLQRLDADALNDIQVQVTGLADDGASEAQALKALGSLGVLQEKIDVWNEEITAFKTFEEKSATDIKKKFEDLPLPTDTKENVKNALEVYGKELKELRKITSEGNLEKATRTLKALEGAVKEGKDAIDKLPDDGAVAATVPKIQVDNKPLQTAITEAIDGITAEFKSDDPIHTAVKLNDLLSVDLENIVAPATVKTTADAYIKEVIASEQKGELSQFTSDAKKAIDSQISNKTLHETLLATSPMYKSIMGTLREQLNLLPPSGGMAGVYSMVDQSVGVFQSPANVSIGSVIKPALNITNDEQEDLNIPLSGKAVNAIRTFPGKGVLVWGARTLDGNSQDWRYISVRRTVIYIEQSIKYAAEAYVFAPNVAATWVDIKAMITNFLTNVWQSGALAGTSAADAFEVYVGLGETMTPVDILDGYMRITVKLAVTRPAEFIVITFQQKMQQS
jgi:phage tail sheath protein FI